MAVCVLPSSGLSIGAPGCYCGRKSEVFREAIRQNSTRIILVHNHPNGDPTPSPDDVRLTEQTVQAGQLLDIEVLDHCRRLTVMS